MFTRGNRDSLQRWGHMHQNFTERGFDFVAPYRGYDESTGEPSERTYYEDARLVYDWLLADHLSSSIVLYGRSLGTAMACYLAAHVRAKKLIMETPV